MAAATAAAKRFHHEELYRGREQLAKLGGLRVVLCGAGALGSNLAETLARQGFTQLRVIDRERVEEHNVNTQVYGLSDVGTWKVESLRNRIFRAVNVEIEALRKELTSQNAKTLLKDAGVVVDTFDNSKSRALAQTSCLALNLPCLHVGLYADYGEALWDEHYRVPKDVAGDVCDYPLARNAVLLAATIAAEVLVRFALEGRRENYLATLKDFVIRAPEACCSI